MQISNSGYVPAFSRHDLPEVLRKNLSLQKGREQGMSGARCTRGLVCKVVRRNAHEHTGSAEAIRHSPRNGFTAYAALSPATNSSCHRRCRLDGFIDPVGSTPPPAAWHQQRVSGPHGFAVRNPSSPSGFAGPGTLPAKSWRNRKQRRSSCALLFAHGNRPANKPAAPDAAASTTSRPAFVTIAKRPFPGRNVASDSADLPDGLSGIFFAKGLDRFC